MAAVKAWLGVAAITASLFVFLTTELMPVGLLAVLALGNSSRRCRRASR
jgi:predicted MFS family arabinose efflux permease